MWDVWWGWLLNRATSTGVEWNGFDWVSGEDEERDDDEDDEDEEEEAAGSDADCTEIRRVWFDGFDLVVDASWPVNEGDDDEDDDEDEVGEVERDGEVRDDDEAVVNDVSERATSFICDLNRFERRKKLPLPNMSPAFGCNAQ